MTGFVKTVPNGTGIEIKFTSDYSTYALVLLRNTKHIAIDGQFCSLSWLNSNLVKPPRCTTGSMGPVNGIKKDVNGARLLPTTVFTYPVN